MQAPPADIIQSALRARSNPTPTENSRGPTGSAAGSRTPDERSAPFLRRTIGQRLVELAAKAAVDKTGLDAGEMEVLMKTMMVVEIGQEYANSRGNPNMALIMEMTKAMASFMTSTKGGRGSKTQESAEEEKMATEIAKRLEEARKG